MTEATAVTLIVRDCIKDESIKRRDLIEGGKSVFGDKSNAVAAVLVHLEGEIEKRVKRLVAGESIYEIVPGLQDEAEYDKEAE